MTEQPVWKYVANLGDATPKDHGGKFLFQDETGTYPPELDVLVEPSFDNPRVWLRYRFVLEPLRYLQQNDKGEWVSVSSDLDGVLNDNPYHPHMKVWFADNIKSIADSAGTTKSELIDQLTSDDIMERAWAYITVSDHYGYDEFDSYPIEMTELDVDKHLANIPYSS